MSYGQIYTNIEPEKRICEYILSDYILSEQFGLKPFQPVKAICGIEITFDPKTSNRLEDLSGSNFNSSDTALNVNCSNKPYQNRSEGINYSDKTLNSSGQMRNKDEDSYLSLLSTNDSATSDLQRTEDISVWWHTNSIDERTNNLSSNIYASFEGQWKEFEKYWSFKGLRNKNCLTRIIIERIQESIIGIAQRGVEFFKFPEDLIEICLHPEVKIRMRPHNISKIAQINSCIDLERYRIAVHQWLKPYTKETQVIVGINIDLNILGVQNATEAAIGLYKGNQVQAWITPKNDLKTYIDYFDEFKTLSNLDHKNILKVYGLHETADCCALIVADCKSIKKYCNKATKIEIKLKIAIGAAEGIKHIHSQGLICGCLTPENIFINSEWRVVLGKLRIEKKEDSAFFCAPEVLANREIDKAADIWSLGMIIYWMLTGNIPFDYLKESKNFNYRLLSDSIEFNRRKPKFDIETEEKYPKLVYLIKNTWSILPENRPIIEDIINDLKELLDEVKND